MKRSPRACRHCGSPAKGNPCWYYVDHPSSGGDPPCEDDGWTEAAMARQRRFTRNWVLIAAAAITLGIILMWAAR